MSTLMEAVTRTLCHALISLRLGSILLGEVEAISANFISGKWLRVQDSACMTMVLYVMHPDRGFCECYLIDWHDETFIDFIRYLADMGPDVQELYNESLFMFTQQDLGHLPGSLQSYVAGTTGGESSTEHLSNDELDGSQTEKEGSIKQEKIESDQE